MPDAPAAPAARAPACSACRATGTITFAGVSGYLLHVRATAPQPLTPPHSRLLLALAAASAAAAVARWRAG